MRIAELRPGPAMIRMPSCRLALEHEPLRGTKVEVTSPHGSVVIADYDC